MLRVTGACSSRVWRALARGAVLAAAAGALAGLATPEARGDLFLVFKVPVAQPGQMVVAFYGDPTTGRPEPVTSLTGLHAYLVPARDRISPSHQVETGPPHSSAWIPLGPLRRSANGSAFVRFGIPTDLAPGLYTIGFLCIRCAPPRGSTFTGSYPNEPWKPDVRFQKLLRVVPLKPRSQSEWRIWEIAALAAAAVSATAVGGAVFFRMRRARRHPQSNC